MYLAAEARYHAKDYSSYVYYHRSRLRESRDSHVAKERLPSVRGIDIFDIKVRQME